MESAVRCTASHATPATVAHAFLSFTPAEIAVPHTHGRTPTISTFHKPCGRSLGKACVWWKAKPAHCTLSISFLKHLHWTISAEPADYDLETGRLNPPSLGPRTRRVHVRSDRVSDSMDEDDDSSPGLEPRGQFRSLRRLWQDGSFRSFLRPGSSNEGRPALPSAGGPGSYRYSRPPRPNRLPSPRSKAGRCSPSPIRDRSPRGLLRIFKCTRPAILSARSSHGATVASRPSLPFRGT